MIAERVGAAKIIPELVTIDAMNDLAAYKRFSEKEIDNKFLEKMLAGIGEKKKSNVKEEQSGLRKEFKKNLIKKYPCIQCIYDD